MMIVGLALGVMLGSAWPAMSAEKKSLPVVKDATVSIPVEEFGKFIKDGRISMPWAEFEKLAGGGNDGRYMKLSWESLLKFLDPSAGVKPSKPPADYILSAISYSGRPEKSVCVLKFDAALTVLKDPADGWTAVKLWPTYTAILSSVTVDGEPANISIGEGAYRLLIDKPGRHRIEGRLSMRLQPDRLTFYVPPGTTSLLRLTVPRDYSVNGYSGTVTGVTNTNQGTEAEVVFQPEANVDVGWAPAVKEPTEPRILAGQVCSYDITPDLFRTTAALRYEILYQPVQFLKIRIPEGVRLTGVSGDLIDWKKESNLVRVELKPQTKGVVNVMVAYEEDLKPDAREIRLTGPVAMDAEKTSGFGALFPAANFEIALSPAEGIVAVDPREVTGIARRPSLGFRFNQTPFAATVKLVRHKELAVLDATIDTVNAITAVTLDNKSVTRVIYHIRNNAKQFLTVNLPAGTQLWSVYVGNAPTKPLAGDGDAVLVPLARAGIRTDVELPVELIYFLPGRPFERGGDFSLSLPSVDIPIMHFMYSLYVPEKMQLRDFSGNLEKVDAFALMDVPATAVSNVRVGGDLSVRGDAKGGEESKLSQGRLYFAKQNELELNVQQAAPANKPMLTAGVAYDRVSSVSESGPGLLPLRVYIPATGQLLRFEKRLVIQEAPVVKARYQVKR